MLVNTFEEKMKRIVSIIVALLILVSSMAYAIGCTGKTGGETTTVQDVETTESTQTTTAETSAEATTEETTTEETTTTEEETEPEYLRPVVDFNDFVFENVERSELDEAEALLNAAVEEDDFDKISEAYEVFNELYFKISTMSKLASIKYYSNTEENKEYDEISTNLDELFNDAMTIFIKVSYKVLTESEHADKIRGEVISEEDCDFVMENYETYTDEFAEIKSRISALEKEYNEALDTKINVQGKMATVDDIVDMYDAGKLTSARYYQFMRMAYKAIAENVAPVYDRIIAAYKEKAQMLGYSSATEMQYDLTFGRTYTPQQAQQFWAYVKEYIVPLYEKLNNSITAKEERSISSYQNKDGLLNKFEKAMVTYFKEVSPEMYNAYLYINKCNLLDISSDSKRYDSSFTTYFYAYDVPFVFIKSRNGFSDVTTKIHELGHFFDYYMNGTEGSGDLDVAEIHSQGSEMLFFKYVQEVLPGDYNGLLKDQILDLLNAIIEGALHDEFQQKAFELEVVNYDNLYKLFQSLSVEYQQDYSNYIIDGNDLWAAYPHHYQSPFYYISYGVSAISAFELYVNSTNDRQAAIDQYLAIIGATSEEGYLDVITRVGMHSPFEESTYTYLSSSLKKLFKLK